MIQLRSMLSVLLLLYTSSSFADQNVNNNNNNQVVDAENQNQIEVCSDGVIQVQDIQMYCDSPGTYYYGSGKYRNSASCLPGDKAQIRIDFYIAEADIIASNGNYALVDISASGGYWGQDSQLVYESADLCSLSTLHSKGSSCPYEGYYYIKTHFFWDGDSSNGGNAFYPKLTVGFKSSVNKNVYDYGGANTNLCRGSTFITWSDRIAISYANAVGNFVKTFGILLLTILCLGGFIWLLIRRPASVKEARQTMKSDIKGAFTCKPKKNDVDEEFDFRKMRGSQAQDIVDF